MDNLDIYKKNGILTEKKIYEKLNYLTNTNVVRNLNFNSNNLIINNDINYKIINTQMKENGVLYSNNSNAFFFKKKLFFSLLTNLIKKKLTEYRLSYCNILELIGLSFTTTIKNNRLRLNLGYNHSIYYVIPKDVIIHTKKKYIYVFSHSLQRLNFVMKELVNFRKVNAYKLKGIKIKDEIYIKKKKKLSN